MVIILLENIEGGIINEVMSNVYKNKGYSGSAR